MLYRFIALSYLIFAYCSFLSAQENFWKSEPITYSLKEEPNTYIHPKTYLQYSLDYSSLRQFVQSNENNTFSLEIPNPSGEGKVFTIVETSIFEPQLQNKYPNFKSFTGYSVSGDRLKMSMSPFGINVMITEVDGSSYYIDPKSLHEERKYIVYYKSELVQNKSKKFFCKIDPDPDFENYIETELNSSNISPQGDNEFAGDCTKRVYRLALACTGEYAQFHGGTKDKVMAAFNTAITRINGVYEKELAVTLILVNNTDQLIYLNANTDPYTNNDGSAMLGQNQTTINNIIGFSNYDIGHVFSTAGGGIASLRSTCTNRKAQGVTGQNAPIGDPFYIDYVAHELGHQFGANHTQNNSCNRNPGTAVEPGSGSTIMAYAGICNPNVQNNSHDYFHAINLSEIGNWIVGNGGGCALKINIENDKPNISVDRNSYVIPISTSFYLRANTTNDSSDGLTYCWEQMNNETASMPPRSGNTAGPAFRSIPPKANPTRYFPDLRLVYGQWEVLPAVSRNMNFRCTVRDNNINGGCTNEVNVTVATNSLAGPFVVTNPNTSNVNWRVGTTNTVNWDVAKTNQSPIFCDFVDIYLSINGGTSYPILLASNQPNTGMADVFVPNLPTTQAKVMVLASNNIFYDVSNTNFRISSVYDFMLENKNIEVCNVDTASIGFFLESKVPNFNHKVVIKILNNPHNIDITLPDTISILPATNKIQVSNLLSLGEGIYPVILSIENSEEKIIDTFYIKILPKDELTTTIISPLNGERNLKNSAIRLVWLGNPLIEKYIVQYSKSPDFSTSNTQEISTNETELLINVESGVYYWRVMPISNCIQNSFSQFWSFSTEGIQQYTEPIIHNFPLFVEKQGTGKIDESKLKINYQPNPDLYYVVTKLPEHGALFYDIDNIQTLVEVGNLFTDLDLKNGVLFYRHFENEKSEDFFNFDIFGEHIWGTPYRFDIRIKQDGELTIFLDMSAPIQCFGEEAKVNIITYNGIPPYTYSFDNLNFDLSNLEHVFLHAGIHTLYVKDSTGLIVSSNELTISQPDGLINESILDGYNVVINSIGGAGYDRFFSTDGIQFSTNHILVDPGNGEFITYVRDVNGCVSIDTIILDISPIVVDQLIYGQPLCFNDSVSVTIDLVGGIPPYNISLSEGLSFDQGEIKLVAGTYLLNIEDAGGKSIISDTIQISQPSQILPIIEINKRNILIETTGGVEPYSYSLDNQNFSDQNVYNELPNGNYVLYVKDGNNCIVETNFSINILEDALITINQAACYGEKGSVDILVQSGTQPYQYGLDRFALDTINSFSDLSDGSYTIFIIDAVGDTITKDFDIISPDSISISFDIRSDTISVLASGGTPPYQYSLDNGIFFVNFSEFTEVPKGVYEIIVKDSNDCQKNATAEILFSSLGESPLKATDILIFPNPAFDKVYLQSDSFTLTNVDIKVYDMSGSLINLPIIKGNAEVYFWEISALPVGVYHIQFTNSFQTITKKLIKF